MSDEPVKRPGGWVDGIGWVARPCDLVVGDWMLLPGLGRSTAHTGMPYTDTRPVVVTRWADGSLPVAPAKPDIDTALIRTIANATLGTSSSVWVDKVTADEMRAAADYIDGVNP